jgi:hypothetical protein
MGCPVLAPTTRLIFNWAPDYQVFHLDLVLVGTHGHCDRGFIVVDRELVDRLRVRLVRAKMAAGHLLDGGDDAWRPATDEVGKPLVEGILAPLYHVTGESLWPVGGLDVDYCPGDEVVDADMVAACRGMAAVGDALQWILEPEVLDRAGIDFGARLHVVFVIWGANLLPDIQRLSVRQRIAPR